MRIKSIAIMIIALLVIACTACAKPAETVTAEELLDLGQKHLLDMDYQQALVCFNKAIEIEPNNAAAYKGLAEVYIGLGQPEKAIEALEWGLQQIPDDEEFILLIEQIPVQPLAPTPAVVTPAPTQLLEPSPMPAVTPAPIATVSPNPTPVQTEVEAITWHEPILEAYRAALRSGDTNEDGSHPWLNHEALWDGEGDIYYALHDIDGNGTLELVIGGGDDFYEWFGCYDIFIHDGQRPIRLFHKDSTGLDMTYGYRTRLYLRNGGTFIIHDEINSNFSDLQYGVTYYFYQLGDDGCTPVQIECIYSELNWEGTIRKYFLVRPGEDTREITETEADSICHNYFEKPTIKFNWQSLGS